jgi:hypothetical protein
MVKNQGKIMNGFFWQFFLEVSVFTVLTVSVLFVKRGHLFWLFFLSPLIQQLNHRKLTFISVFFYVLPYSLQAFLQNLKFLCFDSRKDFIPQKNVKIHVGPRP